MARTIITQTFNFPSSLVSATGASFGNNGQGVDFRLRNGNGVFYLRSFTLSGSSLTITLGQTIRGGSIGNRGFSDIFLTEGYAVLTQASRKLAIRAADAGYSGSNFVFNSSDIVGFASQFQGNVAASLELRDGSPPREYAPQIGWAADISGIGSSRKPFRLWSGEGALTIGGKKYEGTTFDGGSFASVSPVENTAGTPRNRVSISVAVPSQAVRAMLNVDIGPVWIRVFNVVSQDGGRSWTKLPTGIAGRLSAPNFDLEGSIWTAEIETWSGDADRGSTVFWSDAAQQKRHPGDIGMQYMSGYEAGVDIKWPP